MNYYACLRFVEEILNSVAYIQNRIQTILPLLFGGKEAMYMSNRRILVHKLTMVLGKDFDSILDLQISTLLKW